MEAVKNIELNNELYFLIFVFIFFLLSILKSRYKDLSKMFFLSTFDKKSSAKFLKKDNVFSERVNYIINTILIFNISILLLILKEDYSYSNFLKTLSFVILFYCIKYFIVKLLCNIFNVVELTKFSIFHTFLHDKFFSVIITPLLIIYFFSIISFNDYIIYLCLIVLCLIVIYKLYWIYKILSNTIGISTVYIILYLCITEIIPFSLIAKGIFY